MRNGDVSPLTSAPQYVCVLRNSHVSGKPELVEIWVEHPGYAVPWTATKRSLKQKTRCHLQGGDSSCLELSEDAA